MNIDLILSAMNRHAVDYLLVGGVNVLLRHSPITTLDIDFWIEDSPQNRVRCQAAMEELEASWGSTDDQWRPVAELGPDWLGWQHVFCLLSPHGSIDLFRSLKGLENWSECRQRTVTGATASGVPFYALSDFDMLQCQLALAPHEQKLDRIELLKRALQRNDKAS